MRQVVVLTLVTVVLTPAAAARAEDKPDVRALLREVDTATKAVGAVAYEAEFFGEGDAALVERVGRVRGRVWAMQGRRSVLSNLFGGGSDLMKFEGQVQLPGTSDWLGFEIATDGRKVERIDVPQKAMTHGDMPEAGVLLRRGMPLFVREFLHERPFADEIESKSAEYEGEREIGGVMCHVIYVVYKNESESRWFFGKDDNLPRRVERIVNEGPARGATVQQITSLDSTPNLSRSSFRLDVPRGYEVKEFSPDADGDANSGTLAVGVHAPTWELKSPDGKSVRLADLRGNVVVVDFWATWCGPCKLAMPGMQALQDEFAGEPVKVFGINCWERGGDPAAYMQKRKFTYGLLLDGDKVAEQYRINGLPTYYVIDAQGKIAFASSGYAPGIDGRIKNVVSEALAGTQEKH